MGLTMVWFVRRILTGGALAFGGFAAGVLVVVGAIDMFTGGAESAQPHLLLDFSHG